MPKPDNRVVDLNQAFLNNWHPDTVGKKSIYVRDSKVNLLLCSFSKRGTHSWVYDYIKKGIHKTKVFGYYPAMSVKQARTKALEIKAEVVDKGKDYDDVFEVTRHPSYVYFLENKEGLIKIGRSTDWMNRINGLVKSTEGLRVIGIRKESDHFNETKLHTLYRKFRQPNNEYFKDVKGYIKKMIVESVVYYKTDKALTQLIIDQENLIYN